MEDPLEELSGLSLFSRNLAMKPARYTDPDSTHLFIKSLELGNSSKYLEQVKSNVDILSSKELLNQEIADNPIAKKEDEAVAGNEREASRVRRPGLGRKKAKFSMVPKSSQPSLSSEFIPDAELSKDPREFFAYFDRREVAEKELKRLRGESVIDDEIDFSLPIPERQRRPGILGKTATYKHLYPSSTLPETNDTSMSSQKALEDVIISLVKPVLEPESVDPPIGSEKNQTESIAVSEDKIGKLFEELFSSKNLDKDGISSTMLDRLQIKSSIMDEIPVPSFQVIRNDTKTRRALSSIQNIPQTVGGKTPAKDKQVGKTLSQALASSRPSSSPLAPISAFQKHIRQSNLWNDHFSSFELSPPKNSSPVDVDERSDRLDIELNDSTFGNLASPEIITDISVKDQFSKPEMSTDADFRIEDGNEVVTNVDDVAREAISPQVKENVETSSRVHTDFQTAGTDESNENVDDVAREAISPQVKENVETSSRVHSDFQTAGTDESNENVEGMFQNADFFNSDVSTAEKVKSNGHRTDIINNAATETCNNAESIPMDYNQVDEPSEIPLNETTVEISKRSVRKTKEVLSSQTLAEKQSDNPRDDQSNVEALPKNGRKKVTKKPLGVPLNDQTNGVAPPKSRKRKDFSRRSSLAAAGSHWEEGGLRRSSRITTKPLKYWKGERFVYGRVHESLATVIGLKYDSPGQGDENSFEDKRNLKVKSFVSEELKELVMRRSLY